MFDLIILFVILIACYFKEESLFILKIIISYLKDFNFIFKVYLRILL